MTRFMRWERPIAYPFFDIALRDTGAVPVFDMGVDLHDYNGSVYIREDHIIEMARSIGMATVEDVAEMRAYIAKLEAQINKLPTAQEELKVGLANLVSKFHSDLLADDSEPPVGNKEPESDDSFLADIERAPKSPAGL